MEEIEWSNESNLTPFYIPPECMPGNIQIEEDTQVKIRNKCHKAECQDKIQKLRSVIAKLRKLLIRTRKAKPKIVQRKIKLVLANKRNHVIK